MATTRHPDQKKELYENRVRAELDKLNAQINELKAKGKQAEADTRIQYNSLMQELQTKQAATENKLRELQAASEDAWGDIQSGFESAWIDLQTAFKSAVSKMDQAS
jgi:SMC interacting uncharacterized protein involved in chromosome segregation